MAAKPQYPGRKLLLAGGHSHTFPFTFGWGPPQCCATVFNDLQCGRRTVSAMFSSSTCMIELKETVWEQRDFSLNRLARHTEYSHLYQTLGIFSTSKSACSVTKWGSSSVFRRLIKTPKIKQPSLNYSVKKHWHVISPLPHHPRVDVHGG